jgi:fumarylacetoacetase
MLETNETHGPSLTSWVESANAEGCDFPIQNLPCAVFRRAGSEEPFRGGVAIGDQVLDLTAVLVEDVFSTDVDDSLAACAESSLNRFMSMGQKAWSALRLALSHALRSGSELESRLHSCLIDQKDIEYSLPCKIGDYTDFYTSIHHATNIGKLFRPDNPLLPNYKWVPIGYHGRSSSIDVSGQEIRRPIGQTKAPDADAPSFGACKRLDYELEVGIYIGAENKLGESVPIEQADDHVFGYCLFNDWSARDIQAWEYVPLGPFLSKSFASTVSPWIVTSEALIPYRKPWTRDESNPAPMAYLDSEQNRQQGALDIKLEVSLQTETMREQGEASHVLGQSNFAYSYWSVAQMVAHHTVNGCNLKAGDFLGSDTQSGPDENALGSMLELNQGGKKDISLPNGETRKFLEDGDCVVMTGFCEADGAARIGFGEVRGTVLPAKS